MVSRKEKQKKHILIYYFVTILKFLKLRGDLNLKPSIENVTKYFSEKTRCWTMHLVKKALGRYQTCWQQKALQLVEADLIYKPNMDTLESVVTNYAYYQIGE